MKEKIVEVLHEYDPRVQDLVGRVIELEQQYISYPDSNRMMMGEVLKQIRQWIEWEAKEASDEAGRDHPA